MFLNIGKPSRLLLPCLLLTIGTGLFLGAHFVLNYVLQLSLTIRENSPLFHLWKENPMPLYLRLYAYNWTNPEDVYKPHVKPKFHQIGPFVFREIKEKHNLTFNDNDTVSFRQYHTYFFERDLSVADLSTEITTLNPVTTGAAYTAAKKNWGYFKRIGMQFSFSHLHQKIMITKPLSAFLFDGYNDVFITMGRNFPFMERPPVDKFGWFYERNGSTYEGDFNMGTSYHNFGLLQTWNFAETTPNFEGECGSLRGVSAGELYPPHRTKDPVSLLSADLCRPVILDFEEEVDHDGILAYKYSAGTSFLDNGTTIPANKCFCPGECLPSGALNISTCKFGMPGYVSLPNFYGADEYYTSIIEGLYPQKEKHAFYIILEPVTGVPLHVVARLQLNVFLHPVKHISTFESIPRVVFPMLWFEQYASIPSYIVVLLKILLMLPMTLQVIGTLLVILSLYLVTRTLQRAPRAKQLHGTAKELQPLHPQFNLDDSFPKCINRCDF